MGQEEDLSELYQAVRRRGIYSRWRNLPVYLNGLFQGVEFKGRRVLEIGGGAGVISCYAARMGASSVTCIEPEDTGSTEGFAHTFRELVAELGLSGLVALEPARLQDYRPAGAFDLLIMHNTVNHLDEAACRELHSSAAARRVYSDVFAHLRSLAAPGAKLVIADSARRNFFGDIGVRSPAAPTIRWESHHNPELWLELLEQNGFVCRRLGWTPYDPLGNPGLLLANRISSYFLRSHFVLVLEAVEEPLR